MKRTPLAWCNLTHDRVRFGLFVLGIAFAVILMFVQLGFRNALLDSNTQLHDHLRADLVMVSPNRQMMAMKEAFPRRRLAQARAVAGVREVHALYVENAIGMMRDTHPDPTNREPTRGIRVVGVDPDARLLDFPELDPNDPLSQGDALRRPGAALYDRKTKPDPNEAGISLFGPLAPGILTELAGKDITLVGGFDLGTDFTSDGTLILSADTFVDILRKPFTSGSGEAETDVGLVRLEPGADPEAVKAAIQRAVATGEPDPDVLVFTRDEFRDREKGFWLSNTPIGFAFGFGMFMGFAVGLVICYQILSGDVSDHLPEYATLKAIGYGNGYLAWVVLQESLILAVFGYLFGGLVSWGAYELLTATTGLPMRLTLDRAVMLFVATVLMCCASGLVALVGLLRADPADVF
jgi:putative ABC transport system permease protein